MKARAVRKNNHAIAKHVPAHRLRGNRGRSAGRRCLPENWCSRHISGARDDKYLAFLSSAACTGLIGMRFGSVCHCPCTFACALPRAGKLARQIAAQVPAGNTESAAKKLDSVGRVRKGHEATSWARGPCKNGDYTEITWGTRRSPIPYTSMMPSINLEIVGYPVNTGIGQGRMSENHGKIVAARSRKAGGLAGLIRRPVGFGSRNR